MALGPWPLRPLVLFLSLFYVSRAQSLPGTPSGGPWSLSQGAADNSAAGWGDTVVVAGGVLGGTETRAAQVFRFSASTPAVTSSAAAGSGLTVLGAARQDFAGAAAKGHIAFGGGGSAGGVYHAGVDVFSTVAQQWRYSSSLLSAPRARLAAAGAPEDLFSGGGLPDVVLFAGGHDATLERAEVDAVNLTSLSLLPGGSTAPLSLPRRWLRGATCGDTVGAPGVAWVLFGGGYDAVGATGAKAVVDAYRLTRQGVGVAGDGTRAGTSTLSAGRYVHGAAAVGPYCVFAGGSTSQTTADIVDVRGAAGPGQFAVSSVTLGGAHYNTVALSIGRFVLLGGGGTPSTAVVEAIDPALKTVDSTLRLTAASYDLAGASASIGRGYGGFFGGSASTSVTLFECSSCALAGSTTTSSSSTTTTTTTTASTSTTATTTALTTTAAVSTTAVPTTTMGATTGRPSTTTATVGVASDSPTEGFPLLLIIIIVAAICCCVVLVAVAAFVMSRRRRQSSGMESSDVVDSVVPPANVAPHSAPPPMSRFASFTEGSPGVYNTESESEYNTVEDYGSEYQTTPDNFSVLHSEYQTTPDNFSVLQSEYQTVDAVDSGYQTENYGSEYQTTDNLAPAASENGGVVYADLETFQTFS
jgi:hypothetical protein